MKFSNGQPEDAFRSFNIAVTVEDRVELTALERILSMNCTLPHFVAEHLDAATGKVMRDFMNGMLAQLQAGRRNDMSPFQK